MAKKISPMDKMKKYHAASKNGKLRRAYLRAFESKMIYRTTKTENPETTLGMVKKVLLTLRRSV
ncbi:MAG: hypothetical protein AAB932_05930 [Patescibacteria group bacterium]